MSGTQYAICYTLYAWDTTYTPDCQEDAIMSALKMYIYIYIYAGDAICTDCKYN